MNRAASRSSRGMRPTPERKKERKKEREREGGGVLVLCARECERECVCVSDGARGKERRVK